MGKSWGQGGPSWVRSPDRTQLEPWKRGTLEHVNMTFCEMNQMMFL